MVLLDEKCLPLVDAFEQVTGTRPAISTVIRWCVKGSRGIRLESVRIGGRIFTSPDAVKRFVTATTEQFQAGLDEPMMPASRQAERAAEKSAQELKRRLAGGLKKKSAS